MMMSDTTTQNTTNNNNSNTNNINNSSNQNNTNPPTSTSIAAPGPAVNTSVSADHGNNGHQQNLLNKLNLSPAKSRLTSLTETEKDLETLRSSLAARKAAVAAATAAVQNPGLFCLHF